MPAKNMKSELLPQIIKLNRDKGMTVAAACEQLGVHPVTVSRWMREAGVAPVKVRTGRLPQPEKHVTLPCGYCGKEIETLASRPRRFCSRDCTNDWQRANQEEKLSLCPCGEAIARGSLAKYCTPECRKTHGKKKQANPDNYVTFNCLNCGVEQTRYKNYGNGHNKYCSNPCARRHTKTRRFYAVEEFDIVFESSWEMLFWSTCQFLKIPVERFDREQGVEWRSGDWYAPDFWLPVIGVAVEVKGLEDDDDPMKWASYADTKGALVVLNRESLNFLRMQISSFEFLNVLSELKL